MLAKLSNEVHEPVLFKVNTPLDKLSKSPFKYPRYNCVTNPLSNDKLSSLKLKTPASDKVKLCQPFNEYNLLLSLETTSIVSPLDKDVRIFLELFKEYRRSPLLFIITICRSSVIVNWRG